MKKTSVIKGNEEILISVLSGNNCNVLCKTHDELEERVKSFINLIIKFDIKNKIEDNKIKIEKNYVVFSIK